MNINWEKPRGYQPNEMLYADRKMLKWQGFLLSDHNEAICFEAWQEAQDSCEREVSEYDREQWDEKVVIGKKRMIRTRRFLEPDRTFYGTIVYIGESFLILSNQNERHKIYFEEVCDLT